MFGINQFTWSQFLNTLVVIMVLWYTGLFIYALFYTRKSNITFLFEEECDEKLSSQNFTPIWVSAADYPTELTLSQIVEDIPLPQTFYESSGIDNGYRLEKFQGKGEALSVEEIEQIQFYK